MMAYFFARYLRGESSLSIIFSVKLLAGFDIPVLNATAFHRQIKQDKK